MNNLETWGIIAAVAIIAFGLIVSKIAKKKRPTSNHSTPAIENNQIIESFKVAHNELRKYQLLLKRTIPITMPEVQYELQQIEFRIRFLYCLIEVLEKKHKRREEISLFQWSYYIQAATNIADGKLTLEQLLNLPPVPAEGHNTVIADKVQRSLRKAEDIKNHQEMRREAKDHYDSIYKDMPKNPNSNQTSSTEKTAWEIETELRNKEKKDGYDPKVWGMP